MLLLLLCQMIICLSSNSMSDPKTAGADAGSVVSDPQHSQKLLRVLQSLRQDECFQDAVLVLEGEQIPVQKNILAAASPYIRYENKLQPGIHLHEMIRSVELVCLLRHVADP